jgi:archaellum component FlaG (FlaF/FlaG flagellin family)
MRKIYAIFLPLMLGSAANAQSPIDHTVQLTATTQASPAQIKISWKKVTGASGYQVYRKTKLSANWGALLTTVAATDSTYTDNAVVADSCYEYQVIKTGGSNAATGYIYASVKAAPIHNRGTMLLLVDSTFTDSCSAEITTLMNDLSGDGWKIVRNDFARTASVTTIKNYIVSSYNTDNSINALYLLGHLAVPYSGDLNPDAHPDHKGAWPADVFYADVNGSWTDNSVSNTVATGTRNDNTPGDGKYDQSLLPSDVELQTGRIDFSNMPAFTSTEVQMMRRYLNKAHAYKTGMLTVSKQAVIDDNFGVSTGEPFAANGWRNFAPLLGLSGSTSADYITSLNTGNYQWALGCGGGSYTSASGVGTTANIASSDMNGIFSMSFGSYFGDWDNQNNFLRAPLCANVPMLANCWAGRPHWFVHHMALGEAIGFSTLVSQNNDATYGTTNNYMTRGVHIALMGDPSLRTDYLKQVSNVVLTPITGGGAKVTWTASPDPAVIGYYIYSADTRYGTYKRRSPLVNVTTYNDSFGTNGSKYYMVRAVKLQSTPSGSYNNLSLGIVSAPATIDYPYSEGQAIRIIGAISTVSLYPNPATDQLNVILDANKQTTALVTITDVNGKQLYRAPVKVNSGTNRIEISVGHYSSGIYYLNISSDDNTASRGWVKH